MSSSNGDNIAENKKQNSVNELFDNEFILCHKINNNSIRWNCECGFDSVNSVDKYALKLRQKNENVVTTFFPCYKFTPNFMKRQYVRYQLTPRMPIIIFRDNNEGYE